MDPSPKAASASAEAVSNCCLSCAASRHDLHAAPAAARRGLEDHGEADLLGQPSASPRLEDAAATPATAGSPAFSMASRAADLVAHEADASGPRADEAQPHGLHDLGELGVLGEEPVAGVDRVRPGQLRGREHRRHVEVALAGGRRADADGLVGEPNVQGVRVGRGVDRNRRDPQLLAGPDDAERDLPAVGDQDLLEHGSPSIQGRCGTGPRRTPPRWRSGPGSRPPCRPPRSRSRSSASSPR